MSREIKFKAWDGEYMFLDVVPIFYSNEIIEAHSMAGTRLHKVETFLQYTGLKDKNGKEIYEGDYDENFDVVTWCENSCGWQLSVYDFPAKEFICCHCYNCEGDFNIMDEKFKIKGNIYENSELITKK
jgi:hypothetical protein